MKLPKSLFFNLQLLFLIFLSGGTTLAQTPKLRVQSGHTATINDIEFNHTNRILASVGDDAIVRIWHTQAGRELMLLEGHEGPVNAVAFSPKSKILASAGNDKIVRTWNLENGRAKGKSYGHNSRINAISYHPSGKYFASAGNDQIIVWESEFGRIHQSLKKHEGNVLALCFSGDGKRMATADHLGNIFIWNTENWQVVKTMGGHEGRVYALSFSIEGKFLASAGADKTIKIWNTLSGSQVRSLYGHEDEVKDVLFSKDGKYVLSASKDKTVRIWDTATYREINQLRGHRDQVNALAFNGSNYQVASASADQGIIFWDLHSDNQVKKLSGFASFVNVTKYSADMRLIGMGNEGGNVKIIDASSGNCILTLRGHEKAVNDLAFSPDNKMIVSASEDKSLRIWDIKTGKNIFALIGHSAPVTSVNFSPDGKWICSGSKDETVRVWSTASWKTYKILYGHSDGITDVAYSPDGLNIASASEDKSIKIWDASIGTELNTLRGHKAPVNAIAFHPKGGILASGSTDETLAVWNTLSGDKIFDLTGSSAAIHDVDFHPNGKYMVAGDDNNIVRVWSFEKRRMANTFFGHHATVNTVAFSPDGKYVLSGSADQQMKVWDPSIGEELLNIVFLFNERDFTVTTPDGKFDGTESGINKALHFVQGNEIIPLQSLYEKAFTPGLWRLVISGEEVPETSVNINQSFSPSPEVYFISPQLKGNVEGYRITSNGAISDSSVIEVVIEAYDQGGGIDELRLYQNGKLIHTTGKGFKPKSDPEKYKQLKLDVKLIEGMNRLTVIALNDERIESFPDLLEVAYKSFVVPKSKLYMLVIGINEYQNNSYNLNYARDDAQAFHKAVKKGANDIFKEIVSYELLDKKATAENIKAAFDDILHSASEEDVFIFYYAGHGVMHQDAFSEEYFLCPTDVTKMYGNKRILTGKGISASQLNELCQRVRAQKQLILLDACQSGGATEIFSFRGPIEEKAMVQLARSTGVALIAASGSKQYATEVASLGHGVFTYCLLKALEGDADTGISDQKITVGELRTFLETRIPEMSELYKGVTQYPTAYSSGQDFPIVIVK